MKKPRAAAALARSPITWARALLPGVGLTVGLAALSFGAARTLGAVAISPLIIALIIGALVRNLIGASARAAPGIRASARHLLRAGIVILGLQLSIGELVAIGAGGLALIAGTLAGTFFVTVWLGARLGVDPKLAKLIAAGTSICGASAVVATNTVAQADEEDVAYAVASVSLFGTAAVLLYPIAAEALKMSAYAYGLWAGASIHEIGQVAAAAPASEVAMVAKLSRVALLAPVVFTLAKVAGSRSRRRRDAARVEMPWFLVGFVAMMLIGSAVSIPVAAMERAAQAATGLLTVALAGIGLEMDLGKLRTRGWRPLLLGAGASLFICLSSLALILWLRQ